MDRNRAPSRWQPIAEHDSEAPLDATAQNEKAPPKRGKSFNGRFMGDRGGYEAAGTHWSRQCRRRFMHAPDASRAAGDEGMPAMRAAHFRVFTV
jgi:hypothetical protein